MWLPYYTYNQPWKTCQLPDDARCTLLQIKQLASTIIVSTRPYEGRAFTNRNQLEFWRTCLNDPPTIESNLNHEFMWFSHLSPYIHYTKTSGEKTAYWATHPPDHLKTCALACLFRRRLDMKALEKRMSWLQGMIAFKLCWQRKWTSVELSLKKSCNMLLFECMQSLVQNASGKVLEETKTYKNNNQPVQMMSIYYITYSNCTNPGFPLEKGPFFVFKAGCFWQATCEDPSLSLSDTKKTWESWAWGLLNLPKLHVLAVSPTLWQPLGLVSINKAGY